MPITTPSTTGSSFSGPSTGPWGNQGGGGGGSQSGTTTKPPTTTNSTPTPTHQRFDVLCTGLKPNTRHDFYYEGVVRNKDCAPRGVAYGSATWIRQGTSNNATFLTTDSSGKLEFAFFFTPSIEKEVDAANKVVYELAGNKKFEVRATDSQASKIVPFTSSSKYTMLSNGSSSSLITSLFGSFIR